MKIELLTEKDMFFIKKMALGVVSNEIMCDLCIKSNEEFYKTKANIKLKLGIVNDLDFVEKAFNMGLLVVDNFILKNMSDIVFAVAYNMYTDAERLNTDDDLQRLYNKVYDTYLCVLNCNRIVSSNF
jgi:hypothetical protein